MSSDFMPQELDSLLASQRASVYGSSKTGSSDNSGWRIMRSIKRERTWGWILPTICS